MRALESYYLHVPTIEARFKAVRALHILGASYLYNNVNTEEYRQYALEAANEYDLNYLCHRHKCFGPLVYCFSVAPREILCNGPRHFVACCLRALKEQP